MKSFITRKALLVVVLFLTAYSAFGQSLTHPHIWVSPADKPAILDNIEKYDWAESMYDQLIDRNKNVKNTHITQPATFLSALTTIPGDRTSHREDLNTAAECAVIYYLSGDEDYAQLAADIIHHYVKLVSEEDPIDIYFFGNLGDADNHHIMTRECFPRIAIAYDLIHPFISQSATKVYDLEVSGEVTFAFAKAQTAFGVMAENVLKVGGINSNHPLLELAGGLYCALCVEDDVYRQDLFDRFWNGDTKQNGITWMLDSFAQDGDVWPEAVGYAKGVHDIMLRVMNVVDRYDPSKDIINQNLRLFDGAFIYENFKYPNGAIMAYGDSHRDEAATDHIIRYVHYMANRKGQSSYEQKAAAVLKAQYADMGGYKPIIETERLNWDTPLELLWGLHVDDDVDAQAIPLYTTEQVKFSGVVLQRNYTQVDNLDYGLMYYTGGATYVHAHASGIDMELYGAGYVVGPDYGRDVYGSDIHEQYAVSPAAHNTVIVNGATARGEKTNGLWTWQNIVDEVVLEACEPAPKADPLSSNFCFSTQYLDDSFNECKQQRTVSIIRTGAQSGYYLDFFRSKSNGTNSFHDYLFHGLGDAMSLKSDGNTLPLTSTPDRYQNDIGDDRKQPGWRWFTEAKTSSLTSQAVDVRFDLNATNKHLHVSLPAGSDKEYCAALAPKTHEVLNGYANKSTRLLTMRQYGEAWNRPFVAVYEPSGQDNGTVQSVENISKDGKVVGVIVTSVVAGETIEDYVLALDKDDTIDLPQYHMSFTGRFAVVRKVKQTETTQTVTIYIGQGTALTYGDLTLTAGDDKKALKEFYGVPFLNASSAFTLSTRVLGGGGSITASPQKASYQAGEQVVVSATPSEGYVLDEWLGDASGSDKTDTLYFYANRSVMARFRYGEYYYLNVTSENGTVAQSVAGNEHLEKTDIELTATPADRYEFIGWTGDVQSTDNPITVSLDSTINLVANYRELDYCRLTIDVVGNGQVSLLPDQDEYLRGTEVTVFAQANDDDVFQNWSGDYQGVFSIIYVDMDSAITITANFSGVSSVEARAVAQSSVYPNPSNGEMTLVTAVDGVCQYSISNLEGIVIQTGILTGEKEIFVDTPGYYFVQLNSDKYSKTIRVLVQE